MIPLVVIPPARNRQREWAKCDTTWRLYSSPKATSRFWDFHPNFAAARLGRWRQELRLFGFGRFQLLETCANETEKTFRLRETQKRLNLQLLKSFCTAWKRDSKISIQMSRLFSTSKLT